tara:strand:- start:542 stop:1486 length:945 start_codon:yes stop_codon:yes gene_type:complete
MNKISVLEPTNLTEAMAFAEVLSKSGMVPANFQGKPANVLVAIQWGYELGLAPMQALQNISVINGKPSIWGDSMLALVKAHPAFRGIKEVIEGDTAICEIKREMAGGEIETTTSTFSIDEAKRAGLLGKSGPWQLYPQRMLKLRARGFGLRDSFPDAIKGLITTEEAHDFPDKATGVPSLAPEKPPSIVGAQTATEILDALNEPKTAPEKEVEFINPMRPTHYILYIPGREPKHLRDELEFVDTYSVLQGKVYKAEKITPAARRTKLKNLEEVNEPSLSRLDENSREQLRLKRTQMNKVLSVAEEKEGVQDEKQ